MNAVFNNGTLWVAGGFNIQTSNDGIHWSPVLNSPSNINSLAWTGSQWLAACDGSNNLYASNNAIQWYAINTLSAYNIYKIVHSNNTLFALSDSTIYYSLNSDTSTWNSHSDASLGQITDYAYTNLHHTFVSDSTVILTPDLVVWTKVSKPSSGSYLTANSSNLGSALIKPLTLACTDTKMYYSYDAISWTMSNAVGGCNAVDWNGLYWICVGSSPWFAISRDGIQWYQQYDTTFDVGLHIAWNGTMWLASGTKSGSPAIAKSINGTDWSLVTSVSVTGVPHIAWNGYIWLLSDGPHVYSSGDAVVWTQERMAGGDISGLIIQSYSESSNGPATFAFDGSLTTAWASATSTYDASGNGNEWLQVDFGYAVQVNHYALKSNATVFAVSGSADGTAWIQLDTRDFQGNTSNNILLTILNTNAYRYYKLGVTRIGNIAGQLIVNNLAFYASTSIPRRMVIHKSWTSMFTNVGYIQYLEYPSTYANGRYLESTGPAANSYSYNGQYSLVTDTSSVYLSSVDFSFNTASVSMASVAASTFNGTYFIVGGSSLMYAHPTDLTTWTTISGISNITHLKSNTGIGFAASPNTLFLNPGEKLSIVAPKYYDQNMEKRGATFMFSLT